MSVAQQRMEHLAIANRARLDAQAVKRDVAAGKLTIEAALDDPRAACVKVHDLLAAQHRWGPDRTWQVLKQVPITRATTRVRTLTERQKRVIVALVEGRGEEAA